MHGERGARHPTRPAAVESLLRPRHGDGHQQVWKVETTLGLNKVKNILHGSLYWSQNPKGDGYYKNSQVE